MKSVVLVGRRFFISGLLVKCLNLWKTNMFVSDVLRQQGCSYRVYSTSWHQWIHWRLRMTVMQEKFSRKLMRYLSCICFCCFVLVICVN